MRHDSEIRFLYFSLLFSMFCSHDQAFKKKSEETLALSLLDVFSCLSKSWKKKIMLSSTCRSSHQRCSVRKGVLRNFAKFSGKFLCQIIFLIKLQVSGLRPATLLKKRLWHGCFPVNFVNFLKTPFLQNKSWQLLLRV